MGFTAPRRPQLSIVVVVYNMRREAPRTLWSLSPAFQRGIDPSDYELIVVENGSSEPLDPGDLDALGCETRYLYVDDASPSPAAAINLGAAAAAGRYVGVMIDGARLVTPGMLSSALDCLEAFDRPLVTTLGFHLGHELQMHSVHNGYDQAAEDALLEEVDWRRHGYRLFEVSTWAGSSDGGWFLPMRESNLVLTTAELYAELGGFDERFELPGGGIVNFDFLIRACQLPDSTLITLLSEATFHQVHGGVATNCRVSRWDEYVAEYRRIRRRELVYPTREPVFFGRVHPAVIPWLRQSCDLFAARAAGDSP